MILRASGSCSKCTPVRLKRRKERSEHSKPTTTRKVFLKIIIVTPVHLTKTETEKAVIRKCLYYYKRTARAAFTTASNERLRVVVPDACRNMLILLSLCKRVF